MKFSANLKPIAICVAVAFTCLLGAGSGAHAAVLVASITVDHCTGGCGTSPFGSVTVTENAGNLDFKVQLNGSNVFNKSTAFDAFAFNADVALAAANMTNIVDNGPGVFAFDAAAGADGFGNLLYGLTNTVTGGNLLTFTIDTVAALSLADIEVLSTNPPGDTQAYFTADILGTVLKSDGNCCNTGNIGATTFTVSTVPELSTWMMMLLGFAGIGFIAYRRSKKVALTT